MGNDSWDNTHGDVLIIMAFLYGIDTESEYYVTWLCGCLTRTMVTTYNWAKNWPLLVYIHS